jgi:quercetin dioxygenase-like cupin family protein
MNNIFEKGKVLNLTTSVDYSEGGIVSKQIIKSNPGNITLFSFAKGQGLTEHTAPFDAMVQILDGVAEIKIGGEPFILKQGETIIMPANISHALHAIENFKMLLTMIRG